MVIFAPVTEGIKDFILYKLKFTLILLTFLVFKKINYLNKPRSFKSLKVVKNINDINKNKPIRKKPS